jgi:hypothetical protein
MGGPGGLVSNFQKRHLVLEDAHFSTGNGGHTVRIIETEWVPTVEGGPSSSPEYTLETEMTHYGHALTTSSPLIDPNSTQEIIRMLERALEHMRKRKVPPMRSQVSQRVIDAIPVITQVVAD